MYGGPFEKISTASNSYISKYFDVESPDQWRWGSSRYAAFKIKEDKPVCIIPVPRQCDRNSPVLEVVEVMNERPLQSEVKQQIGLCVVRNVNCVSWVREDGVKGGGECLTYLIILKKEQVADISNGVYSMIKKVYITVRWETNQYYAVHYISIQQMHNIAKNHRFLHVSGRIDSSSVNTRIVYKTCLTFSFPARSRTANNFPV